MQERTQEDWPLERMHGRTTIAAYFNPGTREWTATRAVLHENIINVMMAGKRTKTKPKLWIVMGGAGTGKSTLIKSKLVPEQPEAMLIDADQMWINIPEYEALAAADWSTVADRTYAELRYLRDATLAEAAARRLDIILEVSGDDNLRELVEILKSHGYYVSLDCLDCPSEQARERIMKRANSEPTPEDNLWTSQPNPEFPDKYDYQNVNPEIFRREYAKRKVRAQSTDEDLK